MVAINLEGLSNRENRKGEPKIKWTAQQPCCLFPEEQQQTPVLTVNLVLNSDTGGGQSLRVSASCFDFLKGEAGVTSAAGGSAMRSYGHASLRVGGSEDR